mmetsp:Transcript_1991/g.3736  ORF Transcript_1991/g.3736 Transcript_1991/m.3736 type:complete len:369 (+) Transcript_1991:54-1160(+)
MLAIHSAAEEIMDPLRPAHCCREQFPVKLYDMLELADVHGPRWTDAVTWLSHGRAFRILDEREFMEVIVPLFFKQTKIRSFYRQLNLWGFRRLSKGTDAGAWYNEYFLRGAPKEMKKMIRIKIKGNKGKKPNCPLHQVKEPDFYKMPPLPRKNVKKAVAYNSPSTAAMVQSMLGNISRRVSMEMAASSSSNEFYFNNTTSMNVSNHGSSQSPTPEQNLSLPQNTLPSSSFGIVSPTATAVPPTLWNITTTSSHPTDPSMMMPPQRLRRRNMFQNPQQQQTQQHQQVQQPLKPLCPMSSPACCDIEKSKSIVTAHLMPLPFQAPSAIVPLEDDSNHGEVPSDGFEPLPLNEQVPVDAFANYIDDMIQVL